MQWMWGSMYFKGIGSRVYKSSAIKGFFVELFAEFLSAVIIVVLLLADMADDRLIIVGIDMPEDAGAAREGENHKRCCE